MPIEGMAVPTDVESIVPTTHPASKLPITTLEDLQNLGSATLRSIIAYWESRSKRTGSHCLTTLRQLEADADPDKPVLSGARAVTHFPLESKVVYVAARPADFGKQTPHVVAGLVHSFHSGRRKVHVALSAVLYPNRTFLSAALANPHLLNPPELEYFCRNPDFLQVWLKAAPPKFEVVPERFAAALKCPQR